MGRRTAIILLMGLVAVTEVVSGGDLYGRSQQGTARFQARVAHGNTKLSQGGMVQDDGRITWSEVWNEPGHRIAGKLFKAACHRIRARSTTSSEEDSTSEDESQGPCSAGEEATSRLHAAMASCSGVHAGSFVRAHEAAGDSSYAANSPVLVTCSVPLHQVARHAEEEPHSRGTAATSAPRGALSRVAARRPPPRRRHRVPVDEIDLYSA